MVVVIVVVVVVVVVCLSILTTSVGQSNRTEYLSKSTSK